MPASIETNSPVLVKSTTYDRFFNFFIIGYAFTLPLSRAGIVFFSAMIILLFIFKKGSKAQIYQLKNNPTFIAFAGLIAFYLLSLIWIKTTNWSEAMGDITKYWYFLPGFILALTLTRQQILTLLTAFSFGMLTSELISYGIFFEFFSYKDVPPSNPSPFMKHLEYSIFLALSALLTLSRILFEKSNKYKLLYILFFTSLTINLFITGGRSGQLAFVISIVVLFVLNFENKLKAILLSTLLGAVILFTAYNTSDLFNSRVNQGVNNINSVINNGDFCSSWGNRLGALIITKDIITDHPLIGVGTVDNIDLLRETIATKYPAMSCLSWFRHFHNQYAQVVTELGLVGLVLFLLMFYRIYQIPLQDKRFVSIKIMLLSVFLIGFIAEPYLHKQFTLGLFSLIMGLLLAQSRVEAQERNVNTDQLGGER